MNIKISNANQPSWKVVNVKSHIPEALKKPTTFGGHGTLKLCSFFFSSLKIFGKR